jgi:hypothetical protein
MNSNFVRSSIIVMALAALTLVPASAHAQRAEGSAVGVSKQAQPTGATMAPTGANRSMAMEPVTIPGVYAFSDLEGVGKPKAHMGVGLAAIFLGLIVGGDVGTIFVVGGSILGLVGLYHYMR